jgi:hypothetical protein
MAINAYGNIVEKMLADPDETVFDNNLERILEFDTALARNTQSATNSTNTAASALSDLFRSSN